MRVTFISLLSAPSIDVISRVSLYLTVPKTIRRDLEVMKINYSGDPLRLPKIVTFASSYARLKACILVIAINDYRYLQIMLGD